MPSLVKVVKYDGEREPFSVKKVYDSAMRAGASSSLARRVSREIENEVYQNITTAEIFKRIRKKLKEENLQIALRFSLKEAMKKLGPAGFIFEDFVRRVLSCYGLKVGSSMIISGRCCKYEIDFLAEKENMVYLGECKYRNNQGDRIDVNVCLKSFAILEDVKSSGRFKDKAVDFLIVTNSRFTEEAMKYASCKGIELLGWNYPKDEGLEDMVENKKLYPITILPSFKGYLADVLRKEGMMLVGDVLSFNIEKFSKRVNIPKKQLEALKREAETLIGKK
jgi:hypothetical protein